MNTCKKTPSEYPGHCDYRAMLNLIERKIKDGSLKEEEFTDRLNASQRLRILIEQNLSKGIVECNSCIFKNIRFDPDVKKLVINLATKVQEIGETDIEIYNDPGAIAALALKTDYDEKAAKGGRRKSRKTSKRRISRKKTSKKRKTSRRKGRK